MYIKEEDILLAIIVASVFILFFLSFFFVIIYRMYRLKLKKHEEDVKLIFQTEEKERSRLGVELHDNIGAHLSIIKLHASKIKNISQDDKISKSSEKIILNATESIDSLYDLLMNLVPKKLKEDGWISTLRELILSINTENDDFIKLSVYGLVARFDFNSEIIIYRIMQELLNNALKHSNATSILIQIESLDSKLLISFKDNGIGLKNIGLKSGHGLKNIGTRVKSLKGKIELDENSEIGAKFNIVFSLPELKAYQ